MYDRKLDSLHHTINMGWGKGGDAIPQDCCISPLQQHSQTSPEVVDSCCHIGPHLKVPIWELWSPFGDFGPHLGTGTLIPNAEKE